MITWWYPFLKKILFSFDPELSHELTLNSLNLIKNMHLAEPFFQKAILVPHTCMGLHFPNPLGLAAGLDKNGDFIDALAMLGFGFIEIGSITPKPQQGNSKPRLFRLIKEEALINRMGFNNKGVDYLVERLKKTRYKGILGINIGKNKDTPLDKAADDYLFVLRRVLPYASYVTINISSPNTEKLRELQYGEMLRQLLQVLKKEQAAFTKEHNRYVPLIIKIAPDLIDHELADMAEIFLDTKIDGVIATNTTLSRSGVENSPFVNETGGLSGKPLARISLPIIKQLNYFLKNQVPIIGCGGIMNADDAKDKLDAGASLLQIYTGLIYQGPGLIAQILKNVDFRISN